MNFFKFGSESKVEKPPISPKALEEITSHAALREITDANFTLEDELDTFLINRERIIKEATQVGDGMIGADHGLILQKAEELAELFKAKGYLVNPQLFVECPYLL